MIGLPNPHLQSVIDILRQFPEVEQAGFFGSRAKGNADASSDVDIVLFGPNVSSNDILNIRDQLDEGCDLPYFFDLILYDRLQDQAIVAHIDRVVTIFYERAKHTQLPRIDPMLY